tara:strand:+ start:523 stop:930 length:408 start_codon:yes stop_codon:yes gene_type:complete
VELEVSIIILLILLVLPHLKDMLAFQVVQVGVVRLIEVLLPLVEMEMIQLPVQLKEQMVEMVQVLELLKGVVEAVDQQLLVVLGLLRVEELAQLQIFHQVHFHLVGVVAVDPKELLVEPVVLVEQVVHLILSQEE